MIEAHYSTETKVQRPQNMVADAPMALPKHTLFSDKDATNKINNLNNDIYIKTQKEKKKHAFNKTLYFKIFGAVGITVAGIAGFDKIKKFFKKT